MPYILDLLGYKFVKVHFESCFLSFISEQCIFESDNFNKVSFCYYLSSERFINLVGLKISIFFIHFEFGGVPYAAVQTN